MRLPTNRPPTHPGEMLLHEFLIPLGISQSELARRIGVSFPRVNEIIKGRRAITADTALRLERLFGMDAAFWLNLQQGWDLWLLRQSEQSTEALQSIQPAPELQIDHLNEV